MNTQPITSPSWWRIRFSHSASYELKLKMSLIFEFATTMKVSKSPCVAGHYEAGMKLPVTIVK